MLGIAAVAWLLTLAGRSAERRRRERLFRETANGTSTIIGLKATRSNSGSRRNFARLGVPTPPNDRDPVRSNFANSFNNHLGATIQYELGCPPRSRLTLRCQLCTPRGSSVEKMGRPIRTTRVHWNACFLADDEITRRYSSTDWEASEGERSLVPFLHGASRVTPTHEHRSGTVSK